MKRFLNFPVAAVCLVLFLPKTHAQQLVYAVTYSETRASFQARFGSNTLRAPVNQQLAMLRRSRKTEIYSFSIADGKSTLLFSDEGMNFEVWTAGLASSSVVTAGNAYLPGVERAWRGQPSPGATETPPAIYEVSLDGSRKFRRLFEMKSNMRPAVFNPAGTKALFQAMENDQYTYYVYDVPSWRLLHEGELNGFLRQHCPDCQPGSSGWLADGRIFITLDPGIDDDASDESHPGLYVLDEDGTETKGIPPKAGQLELPDYVRRPELIPSLIGQVADGKCLFLDYARKKGPLPKGSPEFQAFLVLTDPGFKVLKQFPLQRNHFGELQLSPKAKRLAFVEDRITPKYMSERHLWVQDLESGKETEVFVAPPANPPSSPEPNVTAVILGWAEGQAAGK